MQQAKQTSFRFYLSVLAYMLLALLMRVIAFAPLYFLVANEGALWYAALLCPVLLVFLVLPLRYSFAEALVQRAGEQCFSLKTAFSFGHYGEKLAESLLHALNVLKWGVPTAAALGYAYHCYNRVDALTLLKGISAMGKAATDVWCAVANFFLRLFGSQNLLVSDGGILQGMLVVSGVLVLAVLIWLYGAVRNSATRYIWVLATREERSPRSETRRRLCSRRWKQLGVALFNLVLWLPFAAVVGKVLMGAVSGMSNQLMMAVMQQTMPEIDVAGMALPLALAFVLLYLPLLPVRRRLTSKFATHTHSIVMPQNVTEADEAVEQ